MEIIIEGNLIEAIFIKRINRFIAIVNIDDKEEYTHVPNTGRMREFLIEGCRVIVRKVDKENRKTKYDLLMVYFRDMLINIDSKLPNSLLYKALSENTFPKIKHVNLVKREVTYKSSRFDLACHRGKEVYLIEAKCATLVKENGLATFPDAPTERGRKHVAELIDAVNHGYRGAIIFIIQRSDAHSFTPNAAMDRAFAEEMKRAKDAGVEIMAFICKVEPRTISIDKEVPVII